MGKIKTWIIIGLLVIVLMPEGLIDFSALGDMLPSLKAGEVDVSGTTGRFGIWSTFFFAGICFLGTVAQMLCFQR